MSDDLEHLLFGFVLGVNVALIYLTGCIYYWKPFWEVLW